MKRLPGMILVASALLAGVLSCSRGPKVIPVRKMEKIYREMFLADQWLADFPEKKQKADTTWFYLPIFEKYGYGIDDYRKSVDYYLNDPKRYAEMMDRVVKDMKGEAEMIHRAVDRQEKARQKADSIANALKVYSPGRVLYYEDLFMVNSMTDRIDIHKNPRGVYVPEPVVEDTLFHGPELIIRDTLEVPVAKEPPLPIPCLE